MDTARRVIGILLVVAVPPAILFWLLIHPLAAFWRRLGAAVTYSLAGIAYAVAAFLLYGLRETLLGRNLGTRWPLVACGGALYALTVWIDVLCRRHLSPTALLGAPELSQRAYPGRLLRDGIYRVVRHPRYLSVIVGTAAFALVANYLGAYLVLAACLLASVSGHRARGARAGPPLRPGLRGVPRAGAGHRSPPRATAVAGGRLNLPLSARSGTCNWH